METKMEKGFPAPLFRDPIFDGASDPTVIWNKKEPFYISAGWIFFNSWQQDRRCCFER